LPLLLTLRLCPLLANLQHLCVDVKHSHSALLLLLLLARLLLLLLLWWWRRRLPHLLLLPL
jgi:hypothetical protein